MNNRQEETIEMNVRDALDEETNSTDSVDVEVVRTEILQTRSDMNETLNAIKEKLNPQALMDQAKDTVSDMTAGLAEQAKSTIHEVTADVVEQAKTTAHEVAGDVVEQTRTTVHAVVTDVTDHAKEAAKGAVSGAVSGAVGEAKEAVGHAVGSAVDTAKEASTSMIDLIKQNPVPAALIGIGLGWLYMSKRNNQPQPARYQQPYYDARYNAGPGYERRETGGYPGEDAGRGIVDQVQEKASHAVEKVGDAASTVREKVGDAASTVREKASDAASTVREKAGDVAETVVDSTRSAGSSVVDLVKNNPVPAALAGLSLGWLFMNNQSQQQRPTERWAGDYRPRPGNYDYPEGERRELPSEQARREPGYQAGQTSSYRSETYRGGSQTGQPARRTVDRIQENIERNPLAIGAVALGIGAAVGLLLPETETENRAMGEVRDKVVDMAQQAAGEVKMRAQIVAEEAIDTVKQESKSQGLISQ